VGAYSDFSNPEQMISLKKRLLPRSHHLIIHGHGVEKQRIYTKTKQLAGMMVVSIIQ
jgi:hypothetical protein